MAEFGGTKKSICSSPTKIDCYNSLNEPACEMINTRALRLAINEKDQTLGDLED